LVLSLTTIEFVRGFPLNERTLCSEPVCAWAHYRGTRPVNRFTQLRLWKELGAERGAEKIAERMRLSEIAPCASVPGDAVLLKCKDGARLLGICAGEFSIVSGFGKIHVGRFLILRAWSLQ
jgi:hypothetical protein